ncbi:MAG: hypothetical protein ACFKPT_08380 [Gloeotrichia echinulata GP01]
MAKISDISDLFSKRFHIVSVAEGSRVKGQGSRVKGQGSRGRGQGVGAQGLAPLR